MSNEDAGIHEEISSKCSELHFICDNFAPEMHLDDITEHFRFLRNSCTSGKSFQNSVAKHLECIENLLKLLINRSDNSENLQLAIRVGMQVLGNMIVSNPENQSLVWKNCSYILSHVLNSLDEKAANYAAMAVYNIILGLGQEELMNYMDLKIIKGLLSSACNGSEFGHFAAVTLLGIPNWLVECYPLLVSHEKYYILDVISDHITKPKGNADPKKEIHISAIKFIASEFCVHSDRIFDARVKSESDSKVTELFESSSPCEYTKLLDVLASAASNEAYLPTLQSDGPLLVHTTYLLKSIHASGKLAEEKGDLTHPFAPIKNLQASESSKLAVDLHPAYGFKRSLIQLIGNLAWKNKEIQNKILELECVPLILESCNIDERNPFITQWAIMAIRNLSDGNLQVQQLIAGLNRKGVVSNELLREMGLTLHDPGDSSKKISIVPLPRKKVNRGGRANERQLKYLVDYMSLHSSFAAGRLNGPMGHEKAQTQWALLAQRLNKYGSSKEPEQWKKTWRDLKRNIRAKAARISVAARETGNRPVEEALTSLEEKCLGIIGKDVVEGFPTVPELCGGTAGPSHDSTEKEATITAPDEAINSPETLECAPDHMEIIVNDSFQTPEMESEAASKTKNEGELKKATGLIVDAIRVIEMKKEERRERKEKLMERQTCAAERMAAAMERQSCAAERMAAAITSASERISAAMERVAAAMEKK